MPPAEEDYLGWLYSKVAQTSRSTPSNSHWHLMRKMHATEFVWKLAGDDNRAEDGRDLRQEFALLSGVRAESVEECSVLEMFVALCHRLEFQTEVSSRDWFWEFMLNLSLHTQDDAHYDDDEVDLILYSFVWRLYEWDGVGGAFPLREPERDQREVEIWYQFWDYLKDQDRLL